LTHFNQKHSKVDFTFFSGKQHRPTAVDFVLAHLSTLPASIRLSAPSIVSSGGFVAERRVGRRYRSTMAGAQQHRVAARRSAANAGSGMLAAEARG